MAKKKSAFSNAQAAVMKAFHDLERAIGVLPAPKAKKAAGKTKTKAKKKAAKKTKKRSK